MSYTLYGRVGGECTKHGHFKISIVGKEDDPKNSFTKLNKIHDLVIKKLCAPPNETATGLFIPTADSKSNINIPDSKSIRKPFTDKEFVVKVPTRLRAGLPELYKYVALSVKPAIYKFEKDKHKYIGWNIILEKISIESYSIA
jgi:hypothetical protein